MEAFWAASINQMSQRKSSYSKLEIKIKIDQKKASLKNLVSSVNLIILKTDCINNGKSPFLQSKEDESEP